MTPSLVALALVSSSAGAAPVIDAVQAQIHPAGLGFLSSELSDSTWAIAPDGPVVFDYGCYELTIENLDLALVFGPVSLVAGSNRLALDAEVVSAEGRDMRLDARGTGGACITFGTDIEEVTVRDMTVNGELFPRIVDDQLAVTFFEPLQLDADVSIDLAQLPDFVEEGLLLFLEDALLNFAVTELEEQLPDLLAGLTVDGFLYQTEIAGFSLGILPSAVTSSEEGLYASATVDLGGDGGPGRRVDLSPRGDSHIAVGLTEALVEEVAVAAFDQGLIQPGSDTTGDLFRDLLEGLGLGTDLQVQLGTNVAPRVRIADGVMAIALPQTSLSIRNAEDELLLSLDVDLDGLLELRVDAGSLRLTAHELVASITRLDASRVLEEGPENLQGFLEGWAVRAAAAALEDLEIYESHFEALGYVLRVDESAFEDQAALAWATLFRSDDPRVDRTPPDTTGQVRLDGAVLRATFSGTDDREGPLVYSYRVNGGSWSTWSADTEAVVAASPGANRFEVKARDIWHNEDPTPAGGTVEFVDATGGCGCTPTGAPSSGLGGLALLGWLFARRRQR